MAESRADPSPALGEHAEDWGYEGARRFALELGRKLTPAERLEWLERTMAEMRTLCGLANGAQSPPTPPKG